MRGSTGYAAAEDRSLANDVNTNEVTSTGGTRGERKPTERDSRNKQATGDKEVERYAVLTRASSFFYLRKVFFVFLGDSFADVQNCVTRSRR